MGREAWRATVHGVTKSWTECESIDSNSESLLWMKLEIIYAHRRILLSDYPLCIRDKLLILRL